MKKKSVEAMILLAAVILVIMPAVPLSQVTYSISTTMHKSVDMFNGSFSTSDVAAAPNKAFDVSFSFCPPIDMPNTVVRFIFPGNLVELVKGNHVWTGDVGKKETISLRLSIVAGEEVDAYVRADVEASPKGKKFTSSYYLHVSTSTKKISPESPEEYVVAARQLSPSASAVETNPESPGTITIKGTVKYVNEVGGYSPMRQIKVVLMDDDFGPDEEVAWKYTDYNGYFSFTVNNDDGWLQDGRDPYIKVYSDGGPAYCKSGDLIPAWYVMQLPKCGDNVPDGFTYNYGTKVPAAYNEAWQAIDACLSERDWVYWRSSPYWQRSTKVYIRWPYETWPHSHGNDIHLPSKSVRSWNHVTVHHEYAHCVMWALYGHWPPGSGPSPHYVFSQSSGGFAIAEGWAEFMQCAVDNKASNLADWYGGHGGDIETNDWYNCIDTGDMDGGIIEGSVASIFWDIIDLTSTADLDYLALSFNYIFTVMRYNQPDNMDQFWNSWKARWPTLSTSVGPLCSIYWHYGIDKDIYAPYSGSISINAGATYTKSTSVTLTLSCKDWGSGVTQMCFRNSLDAPWSAWYPYATSKSWTLFPGDGTKYVYVQFRDKKGYTSIYYDTIILDTTKPTVTSVSVYPTKFNPYLGWTTSIRYTLPEPCYVTIRIYNSAGTLVRTLLTGKILQTAGAQSVVWNGKNNAGIIVPFGTYYIRIWVVDRAGNTATTYPITTTVIVSK